MFRLKVDSAIFEKFPDYQAIVVYAAGLRRPAGAEDDSVQLLRAAERQARSVLTVEKLSEHPHISSWRAAYASFGSKPSKYLCSVEALLKRTLKGNDLPDVGLLVNLYNAISIRSVIPAGGEDWSQIRSDLVLHFAKGNEPFVARQMGEIATEYPDAGEVVWSDSEGITCRRWNWRQCARTAITDSTNTAYFVFDRLPGCSHDNLTQSAGQIVELVKLYYPQADLSTDLLTAAG